MNKSKKVTEAAIGRFTLALCCAFIAQMQSIRCTILAALYKAAPKR